MNAGSRVVLLCAALGAVVFGGRAEDVTETLRLKPRVHIDRGTFRNTWPRPDDYEANPLNPAIGFQAVANASAGEYIIEYPLYFDLTYDRDLTQRNRTNTVAIRLRTARGEGRFSMAAGAQFELNVGWRFPVGATWAWPPSVDWSPWFSMFGMGFDMFYDLQSSKDLPFPSDDVVGTTFEAQDSVSVLELPLPPEAIEELVESMLQGLIDYNPGLQNEVILSNFRLHVGRMELRTYSKFGFLQANNAAHFLNADGTHGGSSISFEDDHIWWDKNRTAPQECRIVFENPETEVYVALHFEDVKLRYTFEQNSLQPQIFDGQPILDSVEDWLGLKFGIPTGEQQRDMGTMDFILANFPLGAAVDVYIATNELQVVPERPVACYWGTPSRFKVRFPVRNLSDATDMLEGFWVSLTRPGTGLDRQMYQPSGTGTEAVYWLDKAGSALKARGGEWMEFELSANLGPTNETERGSFTRRFQLEVWDTDLDEPEESQANNIVQFDVEFTNRVDCYVNLSRDKDTPFYRVGEGTMMWGGANNRGFLAMTNLDKLYVNGALAWERAVERNKCHAIAFWWIPNRAGSNHLTFESIVANDEHPADNRCVLSVQVDPPDEAKVGSLTGLVTRAVLGTGIARAQVLLNPQVVQYPALLEFCLGGLRTNTSAGSTLPVGCYQMNHIPAGTYTVIFRAPVESGQSQTSYVDQTNVVTITAASSPSSPIALNAELATIKRAELSTAPGDISWSPSRPPARQEATLSARVRNTGLAAAANVPVAFYAVTNLGGVEVEHAIGTNTISSFPTGTVQTASVSWTPLVAGNYKIRVKVNADRRIEEYKFTDNQAEYYPVTVGRENNHSPTLDLTSPDGGEAWTGRHDITWAASDQDGDTLSFRLYLEVSPNNWTEIGTASGATRRLSWDTASRSDGADYRIKIEADDGQGALVESVSANRFTIDHTPPVARLVVQMDPQQLLVAGSNLEFRGDTSSDALSGVASYLWDFGDRHTSTETNPMHSFSRFGTYTVTLTVKDAAGNEAGASTNLVLKQRPDGYVDSTDPDPFYRGGRTTIAGHARDEDGQLTAFEWRSTLDGSLATGALSGASTSLSHSTDRLRDGDHTVQLRVRDNDGLWNEPAAWHSLRVAMPPAWETFRRNPLHNGSTMPGVFPESRPPFGNTYTRSWSFQTVGSVLSSPAVANLDGEFTNGLEVVVGSYVGAATGKLYAFDSAGNVKWQYPAAGNIGGIATSPACVDTDDDRAAWEHVVFGASDGYLYVLRSSDRTLVAKYPAAPPALQPIESSPAVADLDNDGQKEVVFGCKDGRVYCLTFPNLVFRWSFPTGAAVDSSPAIADLDPTQPGLEIVAGSDNGRVYALSAPGNFLWQFQTGGPVDSSPAVGDVDDDGAPEVVVGSDDGHMYVLRANGAQAAMFPPSGQPAIGAVDSSPAIADLYGTPGVEIAVGSDDGNLYILKFSPGPPPSFFQLRAFALGGEINSSPVVAEIDPNPGRLPPGSPEFRDYYEVVVGVRLAGGTGRVVALSTLAGNPLWQFNTAQPVDSSPAVAELNHSGELEILFGSHDRSVYCLKASYGADAGGNYTVNEGEPLLLDGGNSSGPPGRVLNYYWDLDHDGEFDDATGAQATNTWTAHGEYAVSLLVVDPVSSFAAVDEARVAVLDLGPTAHLTGPTNFFERDTNTFDAGGSASSPDPIVAYEWDWNYNGLAFLGTTGSVTADHAWPLPGTYTVAVRVTDQDGSTDLATLTVQVQLKDTDGDGISDYLDNCPTVFNPDQADRDGDGTGDVCDDDRDGDGVPNLTDNCPDTPNPDQADLNHDGVGDVCDADRDGDGVPNLTDNCPDTSNTNQADCDGDGIGDVCDNLDNAPPLLTCPPDVSVEQTSPEGATVTFLATAADGCDPSPLVTSNGLAVYPPGRTPVVFIAQDAAGNRSTATVAVTVRDKTPPTVALVTPPNGAVLNYCVPLPVAFTVSDAADTNPTVMLRCNGRVVRSPVAPAFLLEGMNLLEVIATDRSGNVGTATAAFTLNERRLRVVAWGDNTFGQTNVPPGLRNVRAIAAGAAHNLCLKASGYVTAWGDNTFGQTNVPSDLGDVVAVAAGGRHSLALERDGAIIAWGANDAGQTNVPPDAANAVAIAAGEAHSLALLQDGTVVAWGSNTNGQTNVPTNLREAVAIAAGHTHSLALTRQGSLVGWGDNGFGQLEPPDNLGPVTAIAAGGWHSLALLANGTVAAWGRNSSGQTNVPSWLSNVVAIAAGERHSAALRADGQVVVWGDAPAVPPGLADVAALAANGRHNLALVGGAPLPPEPPWFLGISFQPGLVQLQAAVEASWNYRLEVSANLQDWSPAHTFTNASSIVTYTDTSPPEASRFYRLVCP